MVGGSGRGELAGLLSFFVFVPLVIEDRLQRVVAEVTAADEPLVVLLDDDARCEPDERAVVGAPLCQVKRVLVGDEGAVDNVGEVAFEAAASFSGALALRQ